jgi:hypothetical protein
MELKELAKKKSLLIMFSYFNSSQRSEINEERILQPLVWAEFILHGSDAFKDSNSGKKKRFTKDLRFTQQMTKTHSFFFVCFFFCDAIGTAATPGLFCQPQVIVKMTVEKQMECRLAGETEVLGENLPQRHFCPSQNPT